MIADQVSHNDENNNHSAVSWFAMCYWLFLSHIEEYRDYVIVMSEIKQNHFIRKALLIIQTVGVDFLAALQFNHT